MGSWTVAKVTACCLVCHAVGPGPEPRAHVGQAYIEQHTEFATAEYVATTAYEGIQSLGNY